MRIQTLFLAVVLSLASSLLAQQRDAGSAKDVVTLIDNSPQVVHVAPPTPRHFYRLEFVLRETGEDKLLSQRTFTMNVSADPQESHERTSWSLRAGTRLPVHDPNGANYVDVGVNLDLSAKDSDNALQIDVTSDISSAAPEASGGTPPAFRMLKVRSAVLASLGKPTTVFTAEDPGSRHQFELQVTATRAK